MMSLMRTGDFERITATMCTLELLRLALPVTAIMAANDDNGLWRL